MGILKDKKKTLKIVRNISLGVLGTIATIYIGTVCYYRVSMIKSIEVKEGDVIYKTPFTRREEHVPKEVVINHKSEIYEITDIKMTLDGEKLELSNMYELNQRYYLPIDEFLKIMGIEFTAKDDIYKFKDITIDLNDNNFIKNGMLHSLRGDSITENGVRYISLNDLENILGIADFWDYDTKTINLFNKEEILEPLISRETLSGKAAMIRLEDVRPGDEYVTNHGIQSMKASADYLYENGAKFHIAWIPRFKDPEKKIDNNLLVDRNMGNTQFVNMLDYILYRGGDIGLHGYTHQAGVYKSGIGSDLSTQFNPSEEETRKIVESSIETAKVLNIPYSFFESAHYHATKKQQAIIEEYVDACFEPYKIYWNFQPVVSKRNSSTIYVPAPLLYTKSDDGTDMAKKIENNKNIDNILTAFYLHPTKEMKYFEFKVEDGKLIIKHLDNSPLQNIINSLDETGHVTISINDLK
ncbi:DUF2334 domain-containing protein [uncultured Clostridium sp.]|uniref:DUF2334 domain-containing protein n=1 Tax=uncultured Clostridium sp. TaxID=59620 RepID=UPI0026329EB7|nr:DUF2334 domain-containing protein [uncultured Clostridium sp.]